MTLDAWLVTLGALGAAVVLGSQALRHIPLTGPLLALGVGAALGPEGLAVFRIPDGHAVLNTVSEIAMAIALMAVARAVSVFRCGQAGETTDAVAHGGHGWHGGDSGASRMGPSRFGAGARVASGRRAGAHRPGPVFQHRHGRSG